MRKTWPAMEATWRAPNIDKINFTLQNKASSGYIGRYAIVLERGILFLISLSFSKRQDDKYRDNANDPYRPTTDIHHISKKGKAFLSKCF